jgi:hypothetical protein
LELSKTLLGLIRHNREPNLAKKWIGQKKNIIQWQVFRKFYDDAIEILLKFCGGAIGVW